MMFHTLSHGGSALEPAPAPGLQSQVEVLLDIALEEGLPVPMRTRFAVLASRILSELHAGSVGPAQEAELQRAIAAAAVEEFAWPGLL